MTLWLRAMGYVFLAPVFIGTMSKIVVDAYEGAVLLPALVAFALFAVAAIIDFVKRRQSRQAAAPERKFTIYRWSMDGANVVFHARYDDGEEHEFLLGIGMTGSKGGAA